ARGVAERRAPARRPRVVLPLRPLPVRASRRAGAVDRAGRGLRGSARRLGQGPGRALQPGALSPAGRRIPADVPLRRHGAGGARGAACGARCRERANAAAMAAALGIPAASSGGTLSASYCSLGNAHNVIGHNTIRSWGGSAAAASGLMVHTCISLRRFLTVAPPGTSERAPGNPRVPSAAAVLVGGGGEPAARVPGLCR